MKNKFVFHQNNKAYISHIVFTLFFIWCEEFGNFLCLSLFCNGRIRILRCGLYRLVKLQSPLLRWGSRHWVPFRLQFFWDIFVICWCCLVYDSITLVVFDVARWCLWDPSTKISPAWFRLDIWIWTSWRLFNRVTAQIRKIHIFQIEFFLLFPAISEIKILRLSGNGSLSLLVLISWPR